MSDQTVLTLLTGLFNKLEIFLARPGVQIQLAIIIVILFVGGFVTRFALTYIQKRWPQASYKTHPEEAEEETGPKTPFNRILPAIELTLFPILTLLLSGFAIFTLIAQSRVVGLLLFLQYLLWALLFYRLFLAVLYAFFSKKSVSWFHGRLFGPLFGVFVIYNILDLFVDVGNLTELVFANMFENPVTFGAFFLATVGLYFWVNAVWGLNDVIFYTVTRFTAINAGRLEASLTLAGYILVIVGFGISLSSLGISSTTFAAVTGGLSVGIGFGMQQVISNFISGILLLFEGSIRPGDYVDADGDWAEVKKLSIRSTLVRTFDGFEVIIPNQRLLTASVINYTGEDSLYRIRINIGAGYDSDPEQVQQILTDVLKNNPNCYPKSRAGLRQFTEAGYTFRVEAWVDARMVGFTPFHNSLMQAIHKEFRKHGVSFPVPQRDVYTHDKHWDELKGNLIDKKMVSN